MVEGEHNARDLTTWGEIAEYLGVTVRTAQKWEAEWWLPVRRLAGPRGRVTAGRAELERWREATLGKPGWRASLTVLRLYAAIVTALLLVCGGVLAGPYMGGVRKGPPARFPIDSRMLIATDEWGRELWRWTFPPCSRRESQELRSRVRVLRGMGR